MIHACDRSGSPAAFNWAVPVFAADWMPLASCIGLPVPLFTTSIIMLVSWAAVVVVMGVFHTDGVVRCSTRPSWYSVASTV